MSNKPVKNDTERPVVGLSENCIFIHPMRYGLVRKTEYVGLARKFFPLPKAHKEAKVLPVENQPDISERSAADAQLRKDAYSYGTVRNSSIPLAKNWTHAYSYHQRIPKQEDVLVESIEEPTTPDRYGYEFAACPMREGWLYTFEKATKLVKEYSISQVNGVVQCQLKRFNKRDESQIQTTASSQKWHKGIPVARSVELLQINFCEIQWDENQLIDLINGDKKDLLSHFQSFHVADWVEQKQEQPGVFLPGDLKPYYVPAYTDTVDFEDVYKERLAPDVNAINHPFVCVHDRWGAASDICEDIARLEKLHEAIIHSSKTGIAVNILLKELLNDPINGVAHAMSKHPERDGSISFDDFEKQYLLAASTYNAVELELVRQQNSPSGTEEVIKELRKQADKVDWPTIYRILNVVARQSMRVNINNTRTSLLAILESDYYHAGIKEVPENFADTLCAGKNILISHDQYLIREPRARDVDIISSYEKRLDLTSFYENKLAENSDYSALMTKVVHVGEGLLDIVKGTKQVLNILDTYVGYFNGEKEITILSNYLNSIKFRELGFDVQLSSLNDILQYAEEISMEVDIRAITTSRNKISRAIYDHLDAGSSIPHIRIKPKATNAIKATQEWLANIKLVEIGMGLAVFNLISGLRGVKDDDSKSNMHKAISIGAASFAATHSIMSYLAARDALSKKLIRRTISKSLVKKVGVITDGLSIVECIFDVRQAFLARNNMQAYAYMGATASAVAGFVYTLKGVTVTAAAISSGASAGGVALVVLKAVWPLLIIAALGIFCSWLAAYHAFSPQVQLYNRYLFNKDGIKKLPGATDFSKITHTEIMRILHMHKHILIDDAFKHWRDYETLLLEFESLYPMIGVAVESFDLQRSWTHLEKRGFGIIETITEVTTTYFKRVNTLVFSCQLLQLSADMEVEYGLISYTNESPDGKNKMIHFVGYEYYKVNKEDLKLEVRYDLTSIQASKFYQQGYFYIRLILSEQQNVYWPNQINEEARYFFVKVDLKEIMSATGSRGGAHVFKHSEFNLDGIMPSNSETVKEQTGFFLNKANTEEHFENYKNRSTLTIKSIESFKEENNIKESITLKKNIVS